MCGPDAARGIIKTGPVKFTKFKYNLALGVKINGPSKFNSNPAREHVSLAR